MDKTTLAWLILRIGYAWLYLYALKALIANWSATEWIVSLVFPFWQRFFAALCVLIMLVASLMLILGIYAQLAGIMLFIYNLIGAAIHYRIAAVIQSTKIINSSDQKQLQEIQNLGAMGHITSAQKNLILAAVALFFVILGSGPLSITKPLW